MKVNELMIGDLVRVNKDVCIKKGTIVKVTAIDAQHSLANLNLKGSTHCVDITNEDNNGGIWAAYLDPIPITEEILEHNGFVVDRSETACKKYDFADNLDKCPQTVVEFYFFGGRISADTLLKCWTKPKDCDGQNSSHICNLRYVHQLQHVLRDCDIDKEINL